MAKTDSEILTMSRIKKLLMSHQDRATRERIATWVVAAAHADQAPTPPAVDPRQPGLFE